MSATTQASAGILAIGKSIAEIVDMGVFKEVRIRGPVHANEAVSRVLLQNEQPPTINAALLEFFEKVHDLSGYQRPQGLYGFPPGPPRP